MWKTLCPAPGAGVEDEPVVVVALGGGDRGRRGDQLGGGLGVAGRELGGVGVVVARHDQHVGRRLRVDVAERDRALGGVHDVGLDVSGDDAAEQAVLHDHAPSRRVIVPHACQPPEAVARQTDVTARTLVATSRPLEVDLDADTALEQLYAAHWRRLVRLAVLLLRDQGAAEEVVQDAFVAMHGRWRSLRDPDKALAYLRQTVVNRSRSALRHRGVVERYVARQRPAPSLADPADTPDARRRPAYRRPRRAPRAAHPPARGAGAALLPRAVRGRDRRRRSASAAARSRPRLPRLRRAARACSPTTSTRETS